MATSIKQQVLYAVFFTIVGGKNVVHAQDSFPVAYHLAAKNAAIPVEVLYAVALTESGIKIGGELKPWPWTLNVAGKGRFFKNRYDACLALNDVLKKTSAKRVDVGIAQINYGYHGSRVDEPCDLLEPHLNLSIAADILKSQYSSNQGWLIAIGRYHSPGNSKHAERYRNIANRHLKYLINTQSTEIIQ